MSISKRVYIKKQAHNYPLHQIISGAVDVLDGSYERAVDKPKSVRCVSRKQVAVVM